MVLKLAAEEQQKMYGRDDTQETVTCEVDQSDGLKGLENGGNSDNYIPEEVQLIEPSINGSLNDNRQAGLANNT